MSMGGANVKLVAGPVSISLDGLNSVCVQTANEMLEAVRADLGRVDILIMAAAVADYRVSEYSDRKIKKDSDSMTIELEKNPDILKTISADKSNGQVFIGFAAESNDVRENALKKLEAKNLDFIVANDISRNDIGFETDENEVLYIFLMGLRLNQGR